MDLTGKGYEKKVPATAKTPEHTVKVRGATQADLKRLLEDPQYGDFSKMIEKVEEPAKSDK